MKTKTIHGNLELKKDTTFDCNLVVRGNIIGKNGLKLYDLTIKGDLNCANIDCWNLNCRNLKCRDLNCGNLKAKNISYFAVAFAYKNINVKSIRGRRKNSRHFCLDGKLIRGRK